MSGGHFDYKQYEIKRIADDIKEYLYENRSQLPDAVVSRFERAIFTLNEAFVYAHRIDWLISGDDGDDTFPQRLDEELWKANRE